MKTRTVRCHKEHLDEVKHRLAELVSFRKRTSADSADSHVNDEKVAKVDIKKMSVERNLILPCFGDHVRALQALVNVSIERSGTITDAVAKIRLLVNSGRSINRSEYSSQISKLTREAKRITDLVETSDLELEKIPELVEQSRRLWEELTKRKGDEDRLRAENNVVLALGTNVLKLKVVTCSFEGAIQEVIARAVESETDLKMAQKIAFAESGLHQKMLID